MIEWWGYVHVDGSLHVKRYFGPDDLSEARESDFVQEVYGPWKVNTREEAIEKLKSSSGR
jgi:hypothetical protein